MSVKHKTCGFMGVSLSEWGRRDFPADQEREGAKGINGQRADFFQSPAAGGGGAVLAGVRGEFCFGAERSVDREVHATANREVGVTRSCGLARGSIYVNGKLR